MTDVPVTPADLAKALRPPRSQWRDVWDQFKTHKGALVGFQWALRMHGFGGREE